MKELRASFELWAVSHFKQPLEPMKPNGEYFDYVVEDCWQAYKAAHEAAEADALEAAAKICETRLDPTRSWTTSACAYFHAGEIRNLKGKL